MSTASLVITTGYESEFSRIAEQLILDERGSGANVAVLDLGSLMSSPTISYAPAILKLGRLTHPAEVFQSRVERAGASYLAASAFLPAVIEALPPAVAQVLNDSVQSAMLTYFRTDLLNDRNRRVRRVRDWLAAEGTRSYFATQALVQTQTFDRAFLPNGRFPVQRLAKVALEAAGISVFHFEKGAQRDHAFLRPYSPHDRIAGQEDILALTANRSTAELSSRADAWLAARQPSASSTNEYSAIWAAATAPDTESAPQMPTIGFFTSSQDEFLHLGPDWQLHAWNSQFEAFSTLMTRFEQAGFSCVLRVHPNLSTKDHACFRREVAGVQRLQATHPNLRVYWHDDPTSSYALLDECAGVVVWDSTIGLEASARGIPVWNCAASYYGLVADTRQVLGPHELDADVLVPWTVDPLGAKRFIAGMLLRDYPLSTRSQDWSTWDLAAPPLAAKLAALAVSGGAPTMVDSAKSIIEPWRHRRAAINWRLLRTKLHRS